MDKNELKAVIKNNTESIAAALKGISAEVKEVKNSIDENREKPWLVPLVSIISVLVGAFIGPFATYTYDHNYKTKPVLNLLAIEILANQQAIIKVPLAIDSFLSNMQSGKPDNTISSIGVQDSVFKSYLDQMNLLDDNTRTDIAVVYEQFYGVDSSCKILQQTNDGYYSGLSYITKASVTNAANYCKTAVQGAIYEANIVLAEILVNNDVSISGFIAEDFLDKIKPGVIAYLDKHQPGAVFSLSEVVQSDGDDGGFATAVELLRLGAKVSYPITNLNFQK